MQGQIDGLNLFPTSTWADGDPVYLGSTAGSFSQTKPLAPNHLVYLGFVTTASNGSAGRMYVRVQNGYEMDELHNVSAVSPANNDILKYNTSTSLWETSNALSTKQDIITLTTSGNSGAATLIGSTLNIPQYTASGQSVNILHNVLGQTFSGAASPVTRYHSISGTISTLSTNCQIPLPTSCVFQNFYFRTYGAQPATGSLVLTLQKNAVDTAVVITIAAGSAAGNFSNNTNSVTFAVGDTWQIKLVQNATSLSTSLSGYSFKITSV
jgi:hypothetical protein